MQAVRENTMPFLNNCIVAGASWAKNEYRFNHVNIQLLVEKCVVLKQ